MEPNVSNEKASPAPGNGKKHTGKGKKPKSKASNEPSIPKKRSYKVMIRKLAAYGFPQNKFEDALNRCFSKLIGFEYVPPQTTLPESTATEQLPTPPEASNDDNNTNASNDVSTPPITPSQPIYQSHLDHRLANLVSVEHFIEGSNTRSAGAITGCGFLGFEDAELLKKFLTLVPNNVPFLQQEDMNLQPEISYSFFQKSRGNDKIDTIANTYKADAEYQAFLESSSTPFIPPKPAAAAKSDEPKSNPLLLFLKEKSYEKLRKSASEKKLASLAKSASADSGKGKEKSAAAKKESKGGKQGDAQAAAGGKKGEKKVNEDQRGQQQRDKEELRGKGEQGKGRRKDRGEQKEKEKAKQSKEEHKDKGERKDGSKREGGGIREGRGLPKQDEAKRVLLRSPAAQNTDTKQP